MAGSLKFAFLVIFATFLFLPLRVLSEEEEKANAVERIMEASNGNIVIDIPQNLLPIILDMPTGKKGTSGVKGGNVSKTGGYRIQVFSDGRNQSTLESRAKARGNLILSKFPKYKGQIYTISSSPNWFTRVGNFRTSEEANKALAELKTAFPGLASEMRIVKSQIVVIK